MRIDPRPIDPDRAVVYHAELIIIAALQTDRQRRALGRRLARYRRNRLAAEHPKS